MNKCFHALFRVSIAASVLLKPSMPAAAQETTGASRTGTDWYLGVGTGYHYSAMRFSNLDSQKYPTKKGLSCQPYSIFAQIEFGSEHHYAFRPQLMFLTRGGTLTEIGKFDHYTEPKLDDVFYKLKARYLDIRIPVLYQFGRHNSTIRPYVGITTIAGLSIDGHARLQQDYNDNSYDGYKVNLSSKNYNNTYFAVAPTAGVRFNFHVGRQAQRMFFASIETSYEIGLTDTYGKEEKDGKITDVVKRKKVFVSGNRKFSGFEIQALLGIPLSIFKHSTSPNTLSNVPSETPLVTSAVDNKKDTQCYTLEEITNMMVKNINVYGKTICAIDAINFEFGKSDIMPESYDYLDKLSLILRRTNSNVIIKGHTDNVGTDSYNMNLSKARAHAVLKYLTKHGVSKQRLSYRYYGASRPFRDNDTEENRTYNRRVEFELK